LIINNPDDISEIILEWECSFKLKMQSEPALIEFFKNEYVHHPLVRLQPRNTMRFSLLDTYAMKWSKEQFPNETFYALDCNGLFSYCALKFPYMVGNYEILMGQKLSNIVLINNTLYYNNSKILGSIFVKILPPKSLKYPFLLYKINDRNYATLCSKCAESETQTFCKHSDNERALIGTYLISEIVYSLTLGYTLLAIFEVHAYTKFEKILVPFVKVLNLLKTKFSNCVQNLTETEKNKYCETLNNELELDPPLQLHPSLIKPNEAKRNFYKLAANSFFGKFSQRSDQSKIMFVNNQQELENFFFAHQIDDLCCLSDIVCMIQFSTPVNKLPPNLNHNVYIGAQIVAYGRQVMHNHVMSLSEIPHCTMYQVNCDSLYFSLPTKVKMPLKIDPVMVGCFKHIHVGEIVNFISFGPRQYSINCLKDKVISHHACISGLSIQHQVNINFDEVFKNLLKKHEEMLIQKYIIPQTKRKILLKDLSVNFYTDRFTLSNTFTRRRNICVNSERIDTLPFGYIFPSDL